MPTIADYYKYAALATAAYVRMGNKSLTGRSFADEAASADQQRLPQVLGQYLFAPTDQFPNPNPWTIENYYGGDAPANAADKSGFAATLFKQGDEKVLAIRGTEPGVTILGLDIGPDGGTDLFGACIGGIGMLGSAITQLVSLTNMLLQMRTARGASVNLLQVHLTTTRSTINQNYVDLSRTDLVTSLDGQVLNQLQPLYLEFSQVAGTGTGVGADGAALTDKITVTGHSLGGSLAVLAARLFPDWVNSEVCVFNSAGIDPVSVNVAAALPALKGIWGAPAIAAETVLGLARTSLIPSLGVEALLLDSAGAQATEKFIPILNRLTGTGTSLAYSDLTIHNLESEDSVPGNDISVVGSLLTGAGHLGPETLVPVEVNSHVIEQMMDALAVHDLLARLKPNIELPEIAKLIAAASNDPGYSEESLLKALGKLLTPNNAADWRSDASAEFLDLWAGKGALAGREKQYKQLFAIEQAIKDKGYQLDSIAASTVADMVNRTSDSGDIAYRYALKELNPFAIFGSNDLYAPLNQNGELELYSFVTGQGSLTATYLAERAEMLSWKNLYNAKDGDVALKSSQTVTYRFIDKTIKNASGNDLTFNVGGRQLGSTGIPAMIIFGGEEGETLEGRDVYIGDHLFGGSGDDILNGNGGNDYLEGGSGNDELHGDDGVDILLGMKGNDVLDGGLDNDILDGGEGNDTYIYRKGDGVDTIFDGDGVGSIRFYTDPGTSFVLDGGKKADDNLWRSEDERFSYTLNTETDGSNTLNINGEGGVLFVKHFISGQLGITLDDAPLTNPLPPAGGREIRGDWAPKPYINPVTGETFPFRWDELGNIERDPGVLNTTGFSEFDNKLDGSPGPDHIVTGDYEDTAYGFEGDDSITGSEVWGSIFYGGAGNDWIEALSYTEHTADYFEFEYLGRTIKLGEDKIYGGAGDDRIYGESEATLAALYDSATLPTGLPGDWSSGGSGVDHIYGGAGDDVLMGGIGEDLLVGGAGQDVLLGDDAYLLRPGGNFWRVLHPNFGDATPGFSGFELGVFPVVNVTQSFPDMVFRQTGDPEFTYYKNGGADDVLIGGAGKDILIGQYGDDKLYGGDDNDILAGWEDADELFGGEGDDLMAGDFGRYEQPNQRAVAAPNVAPAGARNPANSDGSVVDQSGNDFLDGGAGNDTLFGEGGEDVLLGGAGNDTLYGDAAYLPEELHGNDTLDGGAGNDLLYGNAGNDKLYGGSGDDTFDGGAGNDLLDGGAGNDSLAGGEGDDALDGGDGSDTLAGGAGNDVLRSGVGNDQLDGGDGDDVLLAGEGENWLVGGDGNDALYGGSLGDFLSGGAGNDLLDAGAGIDFVYGEEGNDTYVLDFGYGRDFFEDAEGANRIEFGAGIAQEQITAEWAGSALTVAYGFGEDAFTVDLAQFQLDGIDFADGTSWTKKNLVNVAPRVLTAGSEAGDTVEGILYGRNDLQGLGGNDQITGAGYDDLLAGGDGADTLDGAGGSDRYFFTADESGIDRISDSELAGHAYLDWFYENLGIADWEGRATHGGTFEVSVAGDGEALTIYYGTYEEAFADYPEATITFIEPLPEAAPLITRNDTDALDQLVNAGVLARDVVEFGPGLTLADLNITINVNGTVADQHPEQSWYGGGTLAVRWGNAGFDLQVPDVNYGFVGSNLLSDGIDSSYDDPAGSWRGYRLGEGVEAFEFADGGTYSLEEILQQATVVARYGYEFLRGSGYQVIDRSQDSVYFEAGIQASEVQVTSDGADLLITLNDGSAQGRIVDWYADPATVPSITLRFADGTELDTDSITRLGLTRYGTEDSDFLQADSDFSHALYGLGGPDTLVGQGGNDLLDGGSGDDYLQGDAGNDTYIFGRGYGQDVFEEYDETAGNIDTLRFGADIAPSDVVVSGDVVGSGDDGNLILSIDGTDDQVVLQYWFWDEESKIEQVVFADGTVWDVAALESMVPMAEATEDADLIFGTSADDIIDGLGGDDEIAGSRGNDILGGGEGDDYLVGNGGNDILLGGEGADYLEDWNGNNYFDAGGGDDSVYVEFSANFVLGGTGNDEVDNYASGSVIAFNAGDGQDTIYAAAALTLSLGGGIHAADLSLRRDGTDLVLEIGATDSIRLSRQWEQDPEAWPQMTLQLIDGAVTTYDLNEIINQYNGLQANDPSLTNWQIGDALASAELGSSTEFALGGDLAYRYASTGSNDGLAPDVIRGILSDPAFGVDAQPFEAAAPALTGTTGNDVLTGGAGADTLIGSAGNDLLIGGAGNDTYLFAPGDGVDVIQDSAGVDTISFGTGITPDMLTLGLGSLLIKVGDGGDAIHIEGFDPNDVYGSPVIENFAFYDNTVLAYNELLARGFDLAGTESNDVITGTNVADRINGFGGDDILSGGEGDDTLDGGAGSDVLNGGAGSDTYFFGRGSGSDTIEDASGDLDKIVLGDAITPGDLTVTRTNDVLTIHIDGTSDELAIHWQPQSGFQIEQVQFADSTAWDAATLEAQVNHAPRIGVPFSAPDATEDASFAFTLPSDAFFDPDASDALTFSATLADGTVLPTWLAFDGATFSGTPANGDVGSVEIKVTATDHRGLSVVDTFMLNVANVNDAPTLANMIADQDTPEDAAFSFVVPADSFADVDAGDVLSYGATLVDGSPLPAWLSFDAAQPAFSGTPANGDVGTLHVRVTATDLSGANASNDFMLIVTNTNDAPEVASAIADQSTLEDMPFSFALPSGTFADVDVGDALTFSATRAGGLPLPAWLRFDPATHAFTGTPGNDDVGTLSVKVTATDTADASVADTFDITVVNVNDAPELINPIVKQWIADGDAMQFQLPGNTFTDIDIGDSLSYGATQANGTPLPAWLAFDAATRTFSGMPDEADIGTLSLAVTATDTRGATASGSFDLEVTVAPDRALIGTGSDDLLAGRSGNDTLDGLAGNDALSGRSGNDRLTGGAGNDLLDGGTGDDTYVYQAGDGLDTIADESGSDTAVFGAGLTRDNVVARMSADNTTARIRVLDANGNEQTDQGLDVPLDAGGNSPIEWFAFANGDSAGLGDLLIGQEVHYGTRRNDVIRTGRNDDTIYADGGNDTVYAGTGNDVLFGGRGRDILYGEAGNDVLVADRGKDRLYGGYGDDVLDGGRGSDILDGGAGFNTYVFERNFGDDRIVSDGGTGVLRFGAGITARDLSFKRRNDDLVVKVKGKGHIRIEGWFDANAAHQVAGAEFADGTILTADKFVAKGYDYEPERDQDDDEDDDVSHYGNNDGAGQHGATHNDDHPEGDKKTSPDRGKKRDHSDNEWFEKVVEKWDARSSRSAQSNAEKDDARSNTSRGAQRGNRWQSMHDRLSAHLADGHDDDGNGGADLTSLKPGSAHGPAFTQFSSIGYGGVGVRDSSAADLRPFTGLREGLERIA